MTEKTTSTCSFAGCVDPMRSKGLCIGHYLQQRRGEELHAKRPTRRGKVSDGICPVANCARRVIQNGLCNSHAQLSWRMNMSTELIIFVLSKPCGLCGATKDLDVDHDHSCCTGAESCGGCIRGALCRRCNNLVARIETERQLHIDAIRYADTSRRLLPSPARSSKVPLKSATLAP